MARYWIAVASLNHAERGREAGIIQVNHGKLAPLRRMQPGDGVVIYSPTLELGGKDRLQAFTQIGEIKPGEPYQGVMGAGLVAYRRDVAWQVCRPAPIHPLLDTLYFTRGQTNWGQKFRFGLFEVEADDFHMIAMAMWGP